MVLHWKGLNCQLALGLFCHSVPAPMRHVLVRVCLSGILRSSALGDRTAESDAARAANCRALEVMHSKRATAAWLRAARLRRVDTCCGVEIVPGPADGWPGHSVEVR